MFYTRLIFIIFCLCNMTLASAETGIAPSVKNSATGKILYEKHCLRCHQKKGIGEPKIPTHIKLPGYFTAMPLNETSHAWHHSDEQLVNTIRNGLKRTNRMPVFKTLISHKEANEIVAYLKSLWSPRIIACQGPKHMACMKTKH